MIPYLISLREKRKEKEVEFIAIRKELIPYIKRRLRQYKLDDYYQPDDVFNDCFLRLSCQYELDDYYQPYYSFNHRFLQLGVKKKSIKDIRNIPAWFRETAYNVIREYHRKLSRESLCPNEIFDKISDFKSNEYAENLENYNYLYEAFIKLPLEKRELLILRIVEGLSWKEIAVFYSEKGEEVNVTLLRQRKRRALITLRMLIYSSETSFVDRERQGK